MPTMNCPNIKWHYIILMDTLLVNVACILQMYMICRIIRVDKNIRPAPIAIFFNPYSQKRLHTSYWISKRTCNGPHWADYTNGKATDNVYGK